MSATARATASAVTVTATAPSPARVIRAPKHVTSWARDLLPIGIYSSKYFVGPKNSAWGSQPRGGAVAVRRADGKGDRGGGEREPVRRQLELDVLGHGLVLALVGDLVFVQPV